MTQHDLPHSAAGDEAETPAAAKPDDPTTERVASPIPVSVVVPTRNSAEWVVACLLPPRHERVAQIVLVDGASTDNTVELARSLVDTGLQDQGEGPAAARMLGVAAATQAWVLLLDSDVVLPAGGVAALLEEAQRRGLDGLQAQQASEGAGDPWSDALAAHHLRGQSRHWFGTNATLIRREVLEAHPLDEHLRSGEDIDLRMRLAAAGVAVGISESVVVAHRFARGRKAAARQWDDDGRGLGRMVRKHGWQALPSASVPLAVGIAGVVAAPFRRGADGARYYLGFLLGNYRGLWRGLFDRRVHSPAASERMAVAVAVVGLVLFAVGAATLFVGIPIALLSSAMGDDPRLIGLVGLVSVLALVWLEVALSYPEGDRRHEATLRLRVPVLVLGVIGLVLAGVRLVAIIRPFD